MPALLYCKECPLPEDTVRAIWLHVIEHRNFPDETVSVQCVGKEDMQRLNRTYRSKDRPTNVLTFSYGEQQHDIPLCLEVAKEEAIGRGADLADYVALLLVHAFLHATGLDHEASEEDAATMAQAEKDILERLGFKALSL